MSSLETVFECPICFSHYADVEPTTLPCGHSCCLTDAKAINQCHICRVPISKVVALVPNYTLRDAAVIARGKSNEEISFKGPSDSVSAVTAASESNPATSEQKKKKKKKKKKKAAAQVPGVVTDDTYLEDEASSSDEEAGEDKSAPVNPSTLPDYKIRMLTDSSTPVTNIKSSFCRSLNFEDSYNCALSSIATWKEVLISIAQDYGEGILPTRYLLHDNKEWQTSSLIVVIDVLALKVSPLRVIDKSLLPTSRRDATRADDNKDGDVEFPLLAVRYGSVESAMTQRMKDLSEDLKAIFDTRGIVSSLVCTKAEMATALAYLREKEALLSPEYADDFARNSKRDFYKPSFIVPLPAGLYKLKSTEGHCTLPGCTKPGWAICGKCKSAQYCSRDHQVEHWKVHKKVCGKTHEELAKMTAEGAEGPSVVIPIDDTPFKGMASLTLARKGAMKVVFDTSEVPRNIHGDQTIIVKVQLPLFAAAISPTMLVYDECKSFQTHILGTLQPANQIISDLVRTKGIQGLKAYLYARREGKNLRIFTDKVAPKPDW
eukprot:gene24882-30063_t